LAQHIVGIVQARMGSTRLPGKTLIDICGRPFLYHILARMKWARKLDRLVVATTPKQEDDAICALCNGLEIACFRGSENDVLARFYQCAKAHDADIIVRITADDPFKDPEVADRIIWEIVQDDDLDYVSNTIHPTYPEGLDIEVFRFRALEKAWREAISALDREHVTPYIWLHPDLFKLKNVEYEKNLSYMRWTLDTQEDLAMARAVYEKLYKEDEIFLMEHVLNLMEKHPEIEQLNANVERFSGHKKIIEEEG
jgi:spore coat polysaccharide biosynthesis protein SpsF